MTMMMNSDSTSKKIQRLSLKDKFINAVYTDNNTKPINNPAVCEC
jgi:hypothetical protein